MPLTKATNSMILGAVYNVLDYGADNTGATPSTAAIQAAMDAMPVNGGILFFPYGQYTVDDQLIVPIADGVYRKCIYFQGETASLADYEATKITYTKTSGALFQCRGADGTDTRRFTGAFQNLAFFGPGSSETADAVVVYRATGISFDNVEINSFRYGINPESYFWYSNINKVKIAYCKYAIYSTTAVCNGTTISNCRFNNNEIHVNIDYFSSQLNFTNCWFEIASVVEVRVRYGFGLFFDQCYFEYSDGYAIEYLVDTANAGVSCALSVCNSYIETDASDVASVFRITQSNNNTSTKVLLLNNLYSIASGSTVTALVSSSYGGPNGVEVYTPGGTQFRTATGWKAVDTVSGASGFGAQGPLNFGSNVIWTSGSGSPEGVVAAAVGSLYTRTNGGANTTLYVKESGAGSSGWVAK